jgi:uncharacterized protein
MFEVGSAARALLLVVATTVASGAAAAEDAPWGRAGPSDATYTPQKVVYDVAVSGHAALEGVLDRVSYLNNLYGADPFRASIVLVLHGDEIPLFAIANLHESEELMRRAQSLTVAGPIEFRMCTQAAKAHGFAPKDIHGFVQMVPMADAELVQLQQEEGYAYMR